MSLPIPFLDAHPSVQQALDFIAQRFPLGKRDLSNEVLNNFLKLATPANVTSAYGVDVLTWPGGSPLSNTKTITHALGTTPTSVFLTAKDGDGVYLPFCGAGGIGATTFYAIGRSGDGSSPALNTTNHFYWLAIG